MPNSDDPLRAATRDLIDSALRLAAYGESLARLGTGTKSAVAALSRDVQEKANAARTAL